MFYDRFKELCDKKGITCNKAATEIGLSNATPTAWKKRGLTPKGDTLTKIADYFGVSTDYLISGDSLIKDPELKQEILSIFNRRLQETGYTSGFALVRAKTSTDIFVHLQPNRVSGASEHDVLAVAEFLGVTGEVVGLVNAEKQKKPLINEDEELTEYLEMLKTRPECRMLFQLSKNATKEDVEQAVKIIEALRK